MIEYIIEGKMAVIIGCSEEEEELYIPEFINDLPVGKVQAHSFYDAPNLRKVVFPKNLKLVGEYAFASCKKLREVIFEEGIESIEDWAFISCNIETVSLPKSLKMIGENAFMGNIAKADVNDYMEKKDIISRNKNARPKNAAIFPIDLIDNLSNVTKEFIVEKSTYYETQIDFEKSKDIDETSLDLPYIFDGNEFLIGIALREPSEKLSLQVSKESQRVLGKYDDENPDFLVLRLDILSNEKFVGEVVFKSPFSEKIRCKIIEEMSVENENTKYLRVVASLDSYGSGNISREFAMNMFRDLDGKYFTQYKNHLLTKNQYNEIRDTIGNVALDTLKSFLKQISYAPALSYIISVFQTIMSDGEYIGKEEFQRYIGNRLYVIYDSMGTYESFVDVCYNVSDGLKFIEELTGMNYDEIKQRYGLYIQDAEGFELNDEDLEHFKNQFSDFEENYNLYSEYLDYIYKVMNSLNQDFEMRTYQE
ncbi:MAG: leucine-rich repeat domain-containing protein [Erysipelotrichaceae bacterium]|nr:leucine-rich repeat domain-containing protein [Erysipelotrichaceae bacterium]